MRRLRAFEGGRTVFMIVSVAISTTVAFQRYFTTIRTLVTVVQTQQLPFLAAAIAYYAFVSLIPLLIVGLTIATVLAGEAVANQLLTGVGEFVTPEGADLLEETLLSGAGRGGVTALGLGVLVWSGLRIFRGLDIAFSRVYGLGAPKGLVAQLRDALIVVSAIGLGIGVTVLASALIPVALIPYSGYLASLSLLFFLPIVFFPVYYVLPDYPVTTREAIPGAVTAGIGWTALSAAFGIYASQATTFQLYGVLGGVLLLLVWFYFGGLLVLVGAGLNAVLAGRFRDRQLQQEGERLHTQRATMSEGDGEPDDGDESHDDVASAGRERGRTSEERRRRADAVTQTEIDELRREIDDLEEHIEDRTVHREDIEGDLRQYVRRRVRRGHAHGWGPYLVLLYGTAMTLGAFYFLSGGWAVLAMLVIWLSTLGLYALMLIVGITITAAGVPGRLIDKLRNLR